MSIFHTSNRIIDYFIHSSIYYSIFVCFCTVYALHANHGANAIFLVEMYVIYVIKILPMVLSHYWPIVVFRTWLNENIKHIGNTLCKKILYIFKLYILLIDICTYATVQKKKQQNMTKWMHGIRSNNNQDIIWPSFVLSRIC